MLHMCAFHQSALAGIAKQVLQIWLAYLKMYTTVEGSLQQGGPELERKPFGQVQGNDVNVQRCTRLYHG